MIIINNRFIPFGHKYLAINLLGIIFTKGHLSESQLRHEMIHTHQQFELLFIGFYILYVIEWFVRLMQYHSPYHAYLNISFEREAYDNMYDLSYLKDRPFWGWTKYIKNRRVI